MSLERGRGGIHDASQQTSRPVQEKLTGVMNAASTIALGFLQKSETHSDNMGVGDCCKKCRGHPPARPKRSHLLPLLFASVDASWATLVILSRVGFLDNGDATSRRGGGILSGRQV